MLTLGLASVLFSSFAVCVVLILTQRWHGRLSLDHDLQGAQKLHQFPVPRVGGLGLLVGLLIGAAFGYAFGGTSYPTVILLLISASPVFAAGFIEDLTKRVSVRARLYASFASAAMGAWFMDAQLVRLDTPVLDALIVLSPLSLVFTCFAVGGMTNAVNIIDGLNGLAAGCVTLMLAGLGAIAWQVGDILVMKLCLWGIAALLGFLLLNFPFGRIFLGDGGAYLAGFWLSECGILLLKRNPTVSTWAVLLCCIYPVWETLFSMYRRQVHKRVSSGHPDMIHMHHLVYKHVSTRYVRPFSPSWVRHGVASSLIWIVAAACPVVAALSYNQTPLLMTAILAFITLYNVVYRHIHVAQVEPREMADVAVHPERS